MSRVTIFTSDGGSVEVEHMPDTDAMELANDLALGDSRTLLVQLDGESVTHLTRMHIVRVDIDPEDVGREVDR